MSTAPTVHTPERWSASSREYAEKVAPFLMRAFADAHIERLGVDTGTEVLEVGAGSGALTERLARKAKSVLATDFAPAMIDLLRERMDAAGVDNVRCEVMDGQALDLDDDRFDAAACSFALMLFPDRAKGFSELCRVLRPGGRAVVSGWAGPDRFEGFELLIAGLRAAFPDMPPSPGPRPVFSLADPDTFKAEMEAAGFRDVEVAFVARDLHVADFEALWAILTAGTPPALALFDRIGPSGRDAFRRCVAEIVADRHGSGPITLTNIATLASGVAPGRGDLDASLPGSPMERPAAETLRGPASTDPRR